MQVLLKIGDSYSNETFALDIKDSSKIQELLKGKGVTYEGEGVWKYKDVKFIQTSEDFTIRKKLDPIPMPAQVEDEINEI